MKLPDFTEFKAFNDLREKIGTNDLGFFELFDPDIHLTGSERSALENPGLLLKAEGVRVLPDKTLALKNSRVLAYIPDEAWYRNHREYPTYHVAWCSQLEAQLAEHPLLEYLVTSKISDDYKLLKIRGSGEVSLTDHGLVVCKHCLHALRYRDYDEFRNRRRGYSQKVLSDFSLEAFYRFYPQYPLSFGRSALTEKDRNEKDQTMAKTSPD
ncbi:MAG: hypothetical protein DHS20C12_15570 [Pseudohongiella sp.]|nr:MAG: hypothetical protein DHS20C12_15570 [Pseudohongiella sp.]